MNQLYPLLVCQITDTHLFANTNEKLLELSTANSFQAVLEKIKKLNPHPEILLFTGDLSQDETAESYEQFANLVSSLAIPSYWLPGNHDRLNVMEQVLNKAPIFPKKSFQAGGWNFILLNSSVSGCVHGQISPLELDWLDDQLNLVTEMPTLIALHHPPFAVNSDWLDTIKLQNSDELFAVIDRHPQVRLVIFGHIHQTFELNRGNVSYLGTPSTCIQFKPESPKFGLDQANPGFRLLKLYPNGIFETQVERVAYEHQINLAAIE